MKLNYAVYKLKFKTAVHFGDGMLDSSNEVFPADSLFSALYIEAIKMGIAEQFYQAVYKGEVVFSDLLPFIGAHYLVPKPMLPVLFGEQSDSITKKALKKLRFIAVDQLDQYMSGKMDLKEDLMSRLGAYDYRVMANVRNEKDTLPFHVNVFQYAEDCGLYIIIGYKNEEALMDIEDLLTSLSYTGIGGKRSAGLGKFELQTASKTDLLIEKIRQESRNYMSLSVALPKSEELESALEGASYQIIKRSGYVASETYADTQLKKKDLYVMAAGSCFARRFEGDIYDVSNHGKHPVYRYAKPIFIGV